MELLELTKKFSELLKISDVRKSPEALMLALSERKTEICCKWLEICPNLSVDHLQPIFQYYMADRETKMQDYTPKNLARTIALLAEVDKASSCYDMCSGTGALTIQAHEINPDCRFICEEFDERVIPFLIFNLTIRNISGYVIHGDVLSNEIYDCYYLQSTDKFSDISRVEKKDLSMVKVSADCCISNPPYNMRWEPPIFAQLDGRFEKYGVPPKSNSNYAFILTALSAAKKSALLLPTSVLSTSLSDELCIKQEIIDDNKINAVIINPDKMFESTSIGTCILQLDNDKKTATTEFVDMRQTYEEIQREQNGQYGGSSHTGRTYIKTLKTFSESNINQLVSAISERKSEPEFSKSATIEEIRKQEYTLMPRRYIEVQNSEQKHRPYTDIMHDLNRIIRNRNSCKLVINETIAKMFGIDKNLFDQEKDIFVQNNFYKNITGQELLKNDYIQFTKNKGEFIIKCNSKDDFPEILKTVMALWKQRVTMLNEEENIYLAELRDALLPDLISGKIDVSNVEI